MVTMNGENGENDNIFCIYMLHTYKNNYFINFYWFSPFAIRLTSI